MRAVATATSPEALAAQLGVLRVLAPDLCRLIDAGIEEVLASEPPVHGQEFCPCGEKTWDDDWEDVKPAYKEILVNESAKHECAWTRMVKAWLSST